MAEQGWYISEITLSTDKGIYGTRAVHRNGVYQWALSVCVRQQAWCQNASCLSVYTCLSFTHGEDILQEPSKFHSKIRHQIECSPFGFGSPVTLKDTEMSSPRATAMSMSGRFMNMAGFPPRTLPGATIPTVADVSTWPYAFDARHVYKPASFSVTSVSTRLYTPDSSNVRTFGVKKWSGSLPFSQVTSNFGVPVTERQRDQSKCGVPMDWLHENWKEEQRN